MTKKTVITLLWSLIAIITIASVACLLLLPKWKGIFLAGSGGFLLLNLFLILLFIKNNYKNKNQE